MPEDFFRKIKAITKKEWKTAFISAVLIGFLTHMYILTNMLPNHDSLISIYSSQGKFTSGRFFLGTFSGISSFFDLPWVIGSLSILYLALTAVVLTEFFELHKTPAIILASGLIVTFPTVAATFSYMFTADAYMAGILLAVLAVLITNKYKFGFLVSPLILFLSVGIYQANLTVLLTIMTVWLIRELINNQLTNKQLFYSFIRFVSMAVLGVALYAVTYHTYQKFFGGEISNYQGLNQIGQHSVSMLDQLIAIKDMNVEFFFKGVFTAAPINLFEVLNILVVILMVAGVGTLMVQSRSYLSPVRILLSLCCILLLPIFSFALYFISPNVVYHMLMIMASVAYYLLPIIMYDRIEQPRVTAKGFSWITVVVLCLTIFNFSIINNISYFNMALRYEKSYAFMTRVLDRIEQTEGFEQVKKIAVIGRPTMRTSVASKIIPESIPKVMGTTGENFLFESYHYVAMLHNYFGSPIRGVNGEELKRLKESDLVKQMKPWPAAGSVQIEGNIMIVKLS